MAKWKCYRKGVTKAKGRSVINNLIKNGKVLDKTVTSIYDGDKKYSIYIR